jgi:hypothetical protein
MGNWSRGGATLNVSAWSIFLFSHLLHGLTVVQQGIKVRVRALGGGARDRWQRRGGVGGGARRISAGGAPQSS